MFKVKRIDTGEIFTVYGMTGVDFLIWNSEEERWSLVGIENFTPLVEPENFMIPVNVNYEVIEKWKKELG